MRISVDAKKCQGHTLCVMNAPQLFGSSEEDGHAIVLKPEVGPEDYDAARTAQTGCPEDAISLTD